MAKTGGRVKALREKMQRQTRDKAHGGFKRFSTNSVETKEIFGRALYYTGDSATHIVENDDGKRIKTVSFLTDVERRRFYEKNGNGEWRDHIEAPDPKDCEVERRDGGYRRAHDPRANSVDTGETKVRVVPTHKVTTREHLRESLGTGSLALTNWAAPKNNEPWPIIKAR